MDVPSFMKKKQTNQESATQTSANESLPQSQTINNAPPPNSEVVQNDTPTKKPSISSPSVVFGQKQLPLLDIIAPQSMEVDFSFIKINNVYFRTLFIAGYPRFVSPGWLEPIVNFDNSLDISFNIYPVAGKTVLDDLRRKIAEMEAEIATDLERGKIVDPSTQVKLEDARTLQEQLVKGSERYFEFSLYITIPASSLEELNQITRQVESTLGSLLIVGKRTTLDMEKGFLSTSPFGRDVLSITRNMDTTSLATTFPLTSAELSSDKGILYGINSQNDSFIIFDRFSLENSNMTIFATSGAGKSYFVKLEALRSLMLGTEVIVIDPESEYQALAEAVGGEFISFSFNSPSKINPFDLTQIYEEGENQLGLKILTLHSLFKVIMGQLNATQEALLDRALVATYRAKGITQDPATQKREPPLMEDLYKILIGMETSEAQDLAARIEKFVRGSFVGMFDQQTNVEINNPFVVFSVKDMQEALRPIAMFIILDFVWTRIQRDLKKRLLIVDEAWHMMRYEDSAQFLWSVVKRARKYFLGYLSQGEKQLLMGANIGEGIFFAGPHHAPISVVASSEEHELIDTKPQEKTTNESVASKPFATTEQVSQRSQYGRRSK
jgi:hypothetical protein